MLIFYIYLAFVALMSIIAFFTYRADKVKAKMGEWRIRESVLLSLGFFGGAIGALLGMRVFRHKTKHWYFWVINVASLILHILVGAVLFYVLKSGDFNGI